MKITNKDTIFDFGEIFEHMKPELKEKIKCTKGFVMKNTETYDFILLWDRDGELHDYQKMLDTEFEEIHGEDAIESLDNSVLQDKYIMNIV